MGKNCQVGKALHLVRNLDTLQHQLWPADPDSIPSLMDIVTRGSVVLALT